MAAPGESVRLPTAHMVCNGTPPVGDKPSLMTHNEVTTLFHEFGHALQHMLTQESCGPVAGINQVGCVPPPNPHTPTYLPPTLSPRTLRTSHTFANIKHNNTLVK